MPKLEPRENSPVLHRYPALNVSAETKYWVLLHGWGTDSSCWSPLLEGLRQYGNVIAVDYMQLLAETGSADALCGQLLQQLPERFAVMGWSLGGMLATHMAITFPERVSHLITLATNLRFTVGEGWPNAMMAETFEQFKNGFEVAPEKTLGRFAALIAKGDRRGREQLKVARQLSRQAGQRFSDEALDQGLSLLGELDNRAGINTLKVPGLHLYAQLDALVPPDVADDVRNLAGADQLVELVPDACHGLIASQPGWLLERLDRFLMPVPVDDLDKRRVALSFGKAAATYDSVAGLQRSIGTNMLEFMPADMTGLCMDLGCGTGHFVGPLQERGLDVLGLDLSQGMLQFASSRQRAHWLCADAEALPFAENSLDCVFSSLAIQWCHNLPALFEGLKYSVGPGGKLYIATLGPRTLCELRRSWEQVDGYVHVNRFVGRESLEAAIAQAGLSIRQWQSQDIVLQYDALRDLTYELKTLGAHNVNSGQSNGLTGRARIKKLRDSYEAFRQDNGKLPATYEVYYMVLEA